MVGFLFSASDAWNALRHYLNSAVPANDIKSPHLLYKCNISVYASIYNFSHVGLNKLFKNPNSLPLALSREKMPFQKWCANIYNYIFSLIKFFLLIPCWNVCSGLSLPSSAVESQRADRRDRRDSTITVLLIILPQATSHRPEVTFHKAENLCKTTRWAARGMMEKEAQDGGGGGVGKRDV